MSDVTLVSVLAALAHGPRPDPWDTALAPLARRTEVARLRFLQAQAEGLPIAEELAAFMSPALVHKIAPDAWPKIARLAVAGVELRDTLDKGDLREMIAASRMARTTRREADFNAALVSLERLVKMAESHIARIDRLVDEVISLVTVLREMPFASASFVTTKPTEFFTPSPSSVTA